MKPLERVFSPEGALARAIPGYRERSQQVEMLKKRAVKLGLQIVEIQTHGA